MASWTGLALDCAKVARQALGLSPAESPVAVVLGSALARSPSRWKGGSAVPFTALPGLPPRDGARAQGPAGVWKARTDLQSWLCRAALHGYEGHDAGGGGVPGAACSAPGSARAGAHQCGGGCNPSFAARRPDADHRSHQLHRPQPAHRTERGRSSGPRFPDLTHAYDARLATALEEAARKRRPDAARGRVPPDERSELRDAR